MPRSLVATVASGEPTGEIDLRMIGAALKRRRAAWLLPTLAAFLVVGLFVNLVAPRYTAQTQVLLENQETFFTRPDRTSGSGETTGQLDEAAVASQVQLIGSSDIARRAIKALRLEGNPEFDPLAGGSNPVSRILVLLGVMSDPSRETAEARMEQIFAQKLTVFSPPKTRVVTIEFTSRDPQLAARAANEVATLYLAEQSAAKRGMAKTSADSLAAQITDLRSKLADADAARERYRLSSGLLAGTNNMTISGQSLADINTDLSRARSQQADAQAKAATIRDLLRDGRAADVADVTNSPIVRQLWNQRSVAQAQLATEARTLLPEHPRVKELAAQLKEYDAALKSAAKQVATSLENDARVAGQRVANLQTALAQQKTLVGAANSDEVRLAALDRVSQGFKDQLQSSTARYEEALARQTSSATPADARVISRATPPHEASFPKKLPFLIFGTVATLVFAVGWVVAAEILSGRADAGATDEPAPEGQGHGDAIEATNKNRPVPAVPTPKRRASDFVAAIVPPEEGDAGVSRHPIGGAPPPPAAPVAESLAAIPPAARPPIRVARGLGGRGAFVVDPAAPTLSPPTARPIGGGRLDPRGWVAAALAFAAAFARPAAESGALAAPATPGDGRGRGPATASSAAWRGIDAPVRSAVPAAVAGVGWGDDEIPPAVPSRPIATATTAPECAIDDAARRIVDSHVPGRGLHVVGTGIGIDAAASDRIVALARLLAEKGRSIIVDLNATPARLATVGGDENGLATVTMLDGLAELLAGEASFAEVIHRDHATRLHFIPVGRKEADFRDFDLILDALTETYDFIVLLTPAFPQSEIARVMAPYADFIVLSAGASVEGAVVAAIEDELAAAGASVVLAVGAAASATERAVA